MAVIDTDSSTRLTFHDFYAQDNIDIAFIGASHVVKGVNPKLIEDRLGIKCFNLGTSSQTYAGEYYVLKELIRRYDVQTVFLNVEFCGLNRDQHEQKSNWIISDYMKGITKYELIYDLFEPEDRLIMLSGVCRYRGDISVSWCKKNIEAKLCRDYWNYGISNPVYENYAGYVYKGYCNWYEENPNDFFVFKENYGEFDVVDIESNNPEAIEYLQKSIELCRKQGIDVILFSAPVTDFYLRKSGNYCEFSEFIKDFSERNNINYYDFNLLKDDSFSNKEFYNLDHLNMNGADHFSDILCDLIEDPKSHEFVCSISEKNTDNIIGVTYEKSDDGLMNKWKTYSDHNDESYQYMFIIQNEESDVIYESEIFTDPVINFTDWPKGNRYLNIYDDAGNLLGTGEIK